MLRVVLVLPTYLPESFGGAEQQSRRMALALGRLGVGATLIAPRLRPGSPTRERDGTLDVRRLRVRHAPNLGGRHMLSFLGWALKLGWWLVRNRADYDVIHVIHGRLHALPALLAGALLGKPTLVKIGRGGEGQFDIDLLGRKRLLGRFYAACMVRFATAYVANSDVIACDLQRWGVPEARIHRIPNGVEMPPSRPAAGADGPVRLVYAGRLDAEKSLDLMIRGFARVPAGAATLTLVGDGTCRASLESLAGALGVAGACRFTGAVGDAGGLLRECDVYLSTSSSEGMSNALLEAMSHGLVPLVSRVSGAEDIVEHGVNGWLFPSGDEEAYARALHEAVSTPLATRCAMGLRARETIATRFGIDLVAARHQDLYRKLLAPDGAPDPARAI